MPQRCTVCAHPRRDEIDRELAAETRSKRGIARHFGLDDASVERHVRHHLPETLSKAARMKEIARADDLVPRMEKLVEVCERVMNEALGMKFERIKAGHLTLHATRRIQSTLGTLAAAVEKLRAHRDEEKRQDLEGVRARIRDELTVLRERMTEEIERRMAEEVERRVAEELARRGAQNRPDPPVSEGPTTPPAPRAGLH